MNGRPNKITGANSRPASQFESRGASAMRAGGRASRALPRRGSCRSVLAFDKNMSNHPASLTSQEPVFLETKSLPEGLGGHISVNLPQVFPDVTPDELVYLNSFNIAEGELAGYSLVSIQVIRYVNSIEGRIPTTTLIDGGKCYLTQKGVGALRRADRGSKLVKWQIDADAE
jgi:hypothetical protein